jgi:hypothetical protein
MFIKMGHSGYGVYIFFAAMQTLAVFYVMFLLPETKGVPLEYMDALFDDSRPITAHKRVMAQVEGDQLDRQGSGEVTPPNKEEIDLVEDAVVQASYKV